MVIKGKWIEVRMGCLIFVTRAGTMLGYNRDTERWDLEVGSISYDDKFVLATATCVGVFIKSLAAGSDFPFAVAHLQSLEFGRLQLGEDATNAQVREKIADPEFAQTLAHLKSEMGESPLIAELEAAVNGPIVGPDLLAARAVEYMGPDLEVRLFGGESHKRPVPEAVTGAEREFQKLVARVVIENSVLNLPAYRVGVISPFATHSSDYVRANGLIHFGPEDMHISPVTR